MNVDKLARGPYPWLTAMRARYELARVANALLLDIVPVDAPISLTSLVARLEERIATIRAEDPAFDFAFWARGTLAEVIHFLADSGLFELSGATGQELASAETWSTTHVCRTFEGSDYIQRALASLGAPHLVPKEFGGSLDR